MKTKYNKDLKSVEYTADDGTVTVYDFGSAEFAGSRTAALSELAALGLAAHGVTRVMSASRLRDTLEERAAIRARMEAAGTDAETIRTVIGE